ncbi:hypothetical protein [Legionella worsleiensis]|uniref:T2SS substrate NttA domain-containing protein n=1 Tax=Legionella worsleiensis TaxID=45076 RepID=A0A0W1AL41_9GAMM|nr:hypothetical protein [Legionella worsleiensis]KTD82077.1 hypothetical protein Lwor_0380 [Legionella worsleiensis]STY30206.1 Uncharacterised protein [Legionella worsleiensis]
MIRKLLLATTLALSSALIPFASNAEESPSPNEMPKDNWLSSMTPLLPDLICKGFLQDADLKKRFDEIKMTYEQCVTLIPASTSKCQNELYAKMPDKINSESAGTWGRSLGECIGRDFAEKYLVPKN